MTTLKVGSKNDCIFSLSRANIDNINGFLYLNMDLSFLISIDATKCKNNREVYNYIIHHKYEQFAVQGVCFGKIYFTGIESSLKSIVDTTISLVPNIAFIGAQIFEKDLKADVIQSARVYFSGIDPCLLFIKNQLESKNVKVTLNDSQAESPNSLEFSINKNEYEIKWGKEPGAFKIKENEKVNNYSSDEEMLNYMSSVIKQISVAE